MRLLDQITRPHRGGLTPSEVRAVELFNTWQKKQEDPLTDFRSYVEQGYQANGPVFALVLVRMLLLSEVEFAFRRYRDGGLFGNDKLRLLERPWPGGTTGELVARMEQDASLAGNAYVYLDRNPVAGGGAQLRRLRPDRVAIVSDGSTVVAYSYWPDGIGVGDAEFLPAESVAHWAPIPDPMANFRGMSWLTPVAREINADKAMTRHRGKFFENAAVPGLVLKVDKSLQPEERRAFEKVMRDYHQGTQNAYKSLLVEGGADVDVVGANLDQADFAQVQAAGENRLAAAAAVPSIVVGFREGLQAATYSNYQQALRRFVDLTIRPLWRSMAATLERLIPAPEGARLWYDDSRIAALQQDAKDQAEYLLTLSNAAGVLIRAGYEPDAVGPALGLPLIPHTGGIPVTLYQDLQPMPAGKGAESPGDQGPQGQTPPDN